ncbi:hypothetical protein FB562_2719 [Homoserinimonas aerilata]|uniref:Uncharacterized protein n=1 Tax=Homoserinimonas aerilata TaxID=1162970 RepID=A0A542XX23_9MICO|nr:hypothetical protein [Homoserinimonas aerilata]TQL40385.1 hypothetical protein FB562_2719 [Homoserinimonas aerilata]
MTFDPFENQGGAAAWDPDAAAASKKAADKLFASAEEVDSAPLEGADTSDTSPLGGPASDEPAPGTEGDEDLRRDENGEGTDEA